MIPCEIQSSLDLDNVSLNEMLSMILISHTITSRLCSSQNCLQTVAFPEIPQLIPSSFIPASQHFSTLTQTCNHFTSKHSYKLFHFHITKSDFITYKFILSHSTNQLLVISSKSLHRKHFLYSKPFFVRTIVAFFCLYLL